MLWDGLKMVKNVYFNDAKNSIAELFNSEFTNFNSKDLEQIVNFFYKLSNYEEEGTKIRPTIYIANNVNAITKNLDNCYKLILFNDPDSSTFRTRIKSLLYFCKNDWNVYLNINNEGIEYGLIKVLNSIKDRALSELIFKSEQTKYFESKISLIEINVISGGLMILKGIKGNKTTICFNLNSQIEFEWENNIEEFVQCCVTKINTRSVKKLNDIKNIYFNMFHKLFKGVHGTIVLVVDKDFSDRKGFLSDGIWLKEPIELGKLFLQSKNFNEIKLIGYTDLITSMLNYDGITVLNNAGKILAYNVFVESRAKDLDKVAGGARKRAAYTLVKNKNSKIVGVYFQSQDGDNFFKVTEAYKSKTTKKRTTTEKSKLDKKKDAELIDSLEVDLLQG